MIDYTNRPGHDDQRARTNLVHLAAPAVAATHQSCWSNFSVILPSGAVAILTIPLEAAIAIEEANYSISLIGRLNG